MRLRHALWFAAAMCALLPVLAAPPPALAARTITVEPLITWGGGQSAVGMNASLLVYIDDCHFDPDIYGYDLKTGSTFPIDTTNDYGWLPGALFCSDTMLKLVDDPLHGFWQDAYTNLDLYGATVDATTHDVTPFPICTAFEIQQEPGLSENLAVWADWRDHGGVHDGDNSISWDIGMPADIWAYDLQAKRELPIVRDDFAQESPAASGRTVVWQDKRNGNWDIYGATVDPVTGAVSEFPVCVRARGQVRPSISGNMIVWTDARNGNADIYGYDMTTHKTFPVRVAKGPQDYATVAGDMVFWPEFRWSADHRRVLVLRGKNLTHGDMFTVGEVTRSYAIYGDKVALTTAATVPGPSYFEEPTDVMLATIGPWTGPSASASAAPGAATTQAAGAASAVRLIPAAGYKRMAAADQVAQRGN